MSSLSDMLESRTVMKATTRARLLQSQVERLRGRCLARKLFASSRCSASTPLEDCDKKQGGNMIKNSQIENCAGTDVFDEIIIVITRA